VVVARNAPFPANEQRIAVEPIRERFTLALHDTAVEAPVGETLGVGLRGPGTVLVSVGLRGLTVVVVGWVPGAGDREAGRGSCESERGSGGRWIVSDPLDTSELAGYSI
jgi:hypothetical protein